jgi:outer membrane protein assembly factor BamB
LQEGASEPLVDREGNFFYRDPTGLWMLPRGDRRSHPTPVLVARNLPDLTTGPGIDDYFESFLQGLYCFLFCFDPSASNPNAWNPGGGAFLPAPAATSCGDLAVGLWDRFWRLRRRLLVNLKWDLLRTPAVGRGGTTAYVTLKGSKMAAVDQTGRVLWRWDGYATHMPLDIAVGHMKGRSSTTAVCHYVDASGHTVERRDHTRDRLYERTADGWLAAINGDTGKSIWGVDPHELGDFLDGVPVVLAAPGGEQVVLASDKALYGFRGRDGHRLWSLPLDTPAQGSPAVDNNRIYVATYTSLYAIELTGT